MSDLFVDIADFQFRALRRIRIFSKPDDALYGGKCPSWIAVSSRYGIIVCAIAHDKLISLRSRDVHRLTTTKADIAVEVTDVPMKVSRIHVAEQPSVLVALACNCSGRLLSVLMETASGAFVYLYDMCAFSVDYPEKRGPVYSLKLSADANAKPYALEWNPQIDGVFAVCTSDGVLSCYTFNIEESSSITLIGTVKHSDLATCISWSPKGKQLVVGDSAGHIRQYKPEMALVRSIQTPADAALLNGAALRCVGISWLATTDFLVAYSPQTGHEVHVSLLCVKKDAPPQWTHFDDINYCGNKSSFEQRIKFMQLHSWKLVLCASSRSSEVAVLGKVDSGWKAWTLDDSGRIEMPLDAAHHESFPIGLSIDLSSVLPVKIGDESSAERPPCPVVLVLSSNGVLLAFNALSYCDDHQNINRPSEVLPSRIYGTTAVEAEVKQNEQSAETADAIASEKFGSVLKSEIPTVSDQTMNQPQSETKGSMPQPVQPTATQTLHKPLLSSCISESSPSQQQQEPETEMDLTIKLREEFRNKLVVFNEQFFEMRERNDWLEDLKSNAVKQLEGDNDINLDEELLELEKIRTAVTSWIDNLEIQMKESMCSVKEQLEIAYSTDREQYHSGRVLDFNNMHRLNKLEEALAKLEQKLANVEDALTEIPAARSTQNEKTLVLSVNEEQKIATTAKNICKGMIPRRIALCELQQRITTLSAQFKSLKKVQNRDRFSASRNSSFLNSSSSRRNNQESPIATAISAADRRKKVFRYLTDRGPAKCSEAKIITFDIIQSHETGQKELDSTIANIESRLLEAALTPLKTLKKTVMDVGTQSPDYMFAETKLTSNKSASSINTTKTSTLFASNANDKVKISQTQKPSKPTVVSPSSVSFSFKNVNAMATAPAVSAAATSTAICTPEIPSKSIETATTLSSNRTAVADPDVTFSFKNLGATETPKSVTATLPTVFGSTGSSKLDTVTQQSALSAATKSSENAKTTFGSNKASESVTSATATTSTAVTATAETDKSSLPKPGTTVSKTTVPAVNPSSVLSTTSGAAGTETSVSFTFKLPTAEKQQGTTPATISGSTNGVTNEAAQLPPTDIDAMGDEGMMEADGSSATAAATSLFSSSLLALYTSNHSFFDPGLGSAVPSPNASRNVFGVGLKFGTSQLQTSLFGGTAGNKGTSVFGGGSSTSSAGAASGGIFSRAQQSNAASPSSFSFSSAMANSQSSSSIFGAKPGSGSSTFGGAPTFGSKPVFGSPSPLVTAFGQQRQQTTTTNSGFSAFAKSGSTGFGALAASQQQQQSSSSVFGGSGFGALAQQPQKSSIFGGGLNTSVSSSSSSFSTWR